MCLVRPISSAWKWFARPGNFRSSLFGGVHNQYGVTLKMQGHLDEAFRCLLQSDLVVSLQDSGYFSLAQIACEKKAYRKRWNLLTLTHPQRPQL